MLFKRTRAETSGTRKGMTSLARAVQGRRVSLRMMTKLGRPQSHLLGEVGSAAVQLVRPAVVGQGAGGEEAKQRCPWAKVIHDGPYSCTNSLSTPFSDCRFSL